MNKTGKNFYIILTIIFTLAYFVFKTWTFGWITLIFGLVFLALGIIYFTYGSNFARKENKADVDYVLYWITSIFLVLFALFFVDGGDVSLDIYSSQVIKAIPHNISTILSLVCGCVTLVSLITAGIIGIVRKRIAKNK